MHNIVPNLKALSSSPISNFEAKIISNFENIESWFARSWATYSPQITTSIDLRNALFKIAPIDTNLFPAGFNNLNPSALPNCVQAIKKFILQKVPNCKKILILPEGHTRNLFYSQSLYVLQNILIDAGFIVRIGHLDPQISQTIEINTITKHKLTIEPLILTNNCIKLDNFNPDFILLNNDLSNEYPSYLQDIRQLILPPPNLGWHARLKSNHFKIYDEIATEFAQMIDIDPWFIKADFTYVEEIDFMAQSGLAQVADACDTLLDEIRIKYKENNIKQEPYLAIKADNGTYGMGIMMVNNGSEILQINRKQRSKMAASKGSRKVNRVTIQEGVYTFENYEGAIAEPVVYMLGQDVIGSFYRLHDSKNMTDNLNSPGMHFRPLEKVESGTLGRFYVYAVVARLAALAASRENLTKDSQNEA